jgi:hypothetical protein
MWSMSGREPTPKGHQFNMRIDPEMARELNELRDLASTQIVKPTLTDILRAVIRLGIPMLRAELVREKVPASAPADPAPDAHARGARAARRKPKP